MVLKFKEKCGPNKVFYVIFKNHLEENMIKKLFLVIFTCTVLGHTSAPVEMGDANIRRIEKDLHLLQKFVYKRFGGGQDFTEADLTPPANTEPDQEQTLERLNQFEETVMLLTRKVEELSHAVKMKQDTIDTLKEHLSKLETHVATLESSLKNQEKASFDTRLNTMSEDAFVLFLETESQLLADSDKERVFDSFIKRFPNHEKYTQVLKDLIYLLYKQGQYKETARLAGAYYKKTPDAREAPEILLLLAYSLNQLGKTKEACVTIQKIRSSYKELSQSFKQRLSDAEGQYKCATPKSDSKSD